ncbi:MAG TPA: DMT family transporter [Gemmatimonadales bacterium]|nr:DMT family transporter [Hyphomicrobiaceae bacterium]HWC73958.1 DMT family transporter [Gemmatimonadales bacterium]
MTVRPPADSRARLRADLLLIAATLTWGVSFVIVKKALSASTPLAFLSIRFVLATLALAPLVNFRAPWSRGELRGGLLLTVLLASGFACQAVGLQYTTPARSAFIIALSSVLAPLVALIVLRHRTGWLVLIALAIAGIGIYFLTAPDAGGLNRGDLWTMITAVVFGGHIVAVTELSKRYDARRLVWLQIAGTAVGVSIAMVVLEPVRIAWSTSLIAALVFTGVMATAAALVWQMLAQRHMSSARASLLLCLEPVFAAVTSWLYWGEELSLMQAFGAGLIFVGMVLAVVGEARTIRAP